MILATRLLCVALDPWVAWVRLLSAMWTPFLLEPSCHDGPTPAGSQAASLPPLWTCSVWSLQCRTGFHSCNGFWVWCTCLWSMPHWTERYGVSATICELFTDTVNFLNCLSWAQEMCIDIWKQHFSESLWNPHVLFLSWQLHFNTELGKILKGINLTPALLTWGYWTWLLNKVKS